MSGAPEHLSPTTSDRGFDRLPPIPSAYGGVARVYESSASEYPHVWLTATSPKDMNAWRALGLEYDGGWDEAWLHLRIEDAQRLSEQLAYIVEHHYQGDGSGEQ